MKKTSAAAESAILISKKAYNDFTCRIRQTLGALQQPSALVNEAVGLLDRYVRGEGIDLTNADMVVKVALMVLKPEIDKAVRRSSAARQRARLRREKSIPASTHASESSEPSTSSSECPMNRRERREYERELAREQRRYERRLMRQKGKQKNGSRPE